MRASRVAVRLAMFFVAGLSGCYGRYVGPAPYMGGLNGCYGANAGAYGGYEDYGLYGNNYGNYGDCVGGGGANYGLYGHGYDALSGGGYDPLYGGGVVRERLHLRERHRVRRNGRTSSRVRARLSQHRGPRPYGELACDSYFGCDGCGMADVGGCCCDLGGCGCCGGCHSGSYSAYPGGPYMQGDPGWQDAPCCDGCGSGIVYDGMDPGWSSPSPSLGPPPETCAGGSCGIGGPDWGISVPYSHEAQSTDTIPQPIKSREKKEPYFAPPARMPPEGEFDAPSRNGFSNRPQNIAPSRYSRLVPSAF